MSMLKKRKALAEHFNISLRDIKKPYKYEYQDEFTVDIYTAKQMNCEVLDFRQAIEAEHSMLSIEDSYTTVLDFSGPDRIGIYARLINSDYYFRWL